MNDNIQVQLTFATCDGSPLSTHVLSRRLWWQFSLQTGNFGKEKKKSTGQLFLNDPG